MLQALWIVASFMDYTKTKAHLLILSLVTLLILVEEYKSWSYTHYSQKKAWSKSIWILLIFLVPYVTLKLDFPEHVWHVPAYLQSVKTDHSCPVWHNHHMLNDLAFINHL
jgi:hypothetical protein